MVRLALILFGIPLFAQNYDLVIANGRVMDPATNLDAVRNIGIRAGKIAAVSTSPLAPSTARATIDAKGLVVAPASSTCIRTARRRRITASKRATA